MNTPMKHLVTGLLVIGLSLSLATSAGARDNENYGETRWSKLPTRGMVSKAVWVGSWWAYGTDGIGRRYNDPTLGDYSDWEGYAALADRWDNKDAAALSPAEKWDRYTGKYDQIEYAKLMERVLKVNELRADVKAQLDQRRALVRTLNKLISEKKDDPAFDWSTTDEGIEYETVSASIKEKQDEVAAIELTVDTAFEWEVLNHGTAQFNVDSWYGHCNAWAAAAIMEPEPVKSVEDGGVTFEAADLKAYLTELWMEQHSSFYGSRNNKHDDEESRDSIDFRDVTPATFHIMFADQIGNRDRSFVIDRYTGDQVWNQPVKAFRSKATPLYEGEGADAAPLKRTVKYTIYSRFGNREEDRGEQDVYPVSVTTTFHWMTDGVPPEELTVDNISDEIDDETFASSWKIGQMYNHQVEIRTVSYELWLDKPMDDPEARIIGDGEWDHGSLTGFEHLHPDFIWQPIANVNNARDYENEYLSYEVVVDKLLPGSVKPADDPAVAPTEWSVAGPVEIPDADKDGDAALELVIDDDVTIERLEVSVKVTHTYIGDLQVRVRAPDGRSKVIKRFRDYGSQDDIDRTWDVKNFNGASTKGVWRLEVKDQWSGDVGTIDRFTLKVK